MSRKRQRDCQGEIIYCLPRRDTSYNASDVRKFLLQLPKSKVALRVTFRVCQKSGSTYDINWRTEGTGGAARMGQMPCNIIWNGSTYQEVDVVSNDKNFPLLHDQWCHEAAECELVSVDVTNVIADEDRNAPTTSSASRTKLERHDPRSIPRNTHCGPSGR
jgi:hypothetical protein